MNRPKWFHYITEKQTKMYLSNTTGQILISHTWETVIESICAQRHFFSHQVYMTHIAFSRGGVFFTNLFHSNLHPELASLICRWNRQTWKLYYSLNCWKNFYGRDHHSVQHAHSLESQFKCCSSASEIRVVSCTGVLTPGSLLRVREPVTFLNRDKKLSVAGVWVPV